MEIILIIIAILLFLILIVLFFGASSALTLLYWIFGFIVILILGVLGLELFGIIYDLVKKYWKSIVNSIVFNIALFTFFCILDFYNLPFYFALTGGAFLASLITILFYKIVLFYENKNKG